MLSMYERRAVLFLDILGFSELVQRGKEQGLLAALQHIQGRALEIKQAGKMNFTAFSDCVVVSAPLDDGRGALVIANYAQFLALDLLAKRLLTRGAIVIGDLYHEREIVLGPALVEAYQLENKKAIYPRILVTSDVRQGVQEAALRVGPTLSRPHDIYFREDFDGQYHVDLFGDGSNAPETYWGDGTSTGGPAFQHACLTFIDRIFSVAPPPIAAEKYAWLASYFFEKCEENLWPLPDNLPVSKAKRLRYERELHDIRIADQYDR